MQSNDTNKRAGTDSRPAILIATALVGGLAIVAGLVMFRHKPQPPIETAANPEVTASSQAPSAERPGPASQATPPSGVNVEKASNAASPAVAPLHPGASLADLIKALKDPSQSPSARKKAIQALARLGSPEALAALKEALANGSSDVRSAIAESLGECTSAECTATLLSLLTDPDPAIAKAAIRGLAQQGSPQAVEALTRLLYDSSGSPDLRSAAATGLGTIDQPGIVDSLGQAALTLNEEGIVTDVLNALGGRKFSETENFFQSYLHSPNVSSDLRVAAVESLAGAQGDPSAFLLTIASDPDSDVRASAGWALSATESSGSAGPQLLSLLQAEGDPDVRLRLYQALANQDNLDVSTALTAVQNEKDPSARVAGLDLLAKLVRDKPTPELQAYFEQNATPELKQAALTATTRDDRMAATIALIRPNTPQTLAALQDVAQQATDPRVKESAGKAVTSPLASRPK